MAKRPLRRQPPKVGARCAKGARLGSVRGALGNERPYRDVRSLASELTSLIEEVHPKLVEQEAVRIRRFTDALVQRIADAVA